MAWFADLAGRAESLLNNLDEQTGAALRNHNVPKAKKHGKNDIPVYPEPTWGQKKRPIPRNLKKITPVTETKSICSPSRKASPTSHSPPRSPSPVSNQDRRSRKSPVRKPNQYNLNNCPKTLVGDIKANDYVMDEFGINNKHRRNSLPADLELLSSNSWTYKLQNLEVENAMLKNELNVMNRELSELLERLRKTEDELSEAHIKLENNELTKQRGDFERDSLMSQIEQLHARIDELNNVEIPKYRDHSQNLETELMVLRDLNRELEDKTKDLSEKTSEKDSAHSKLESELRHAHSTIQDLQGELERSVAECRRLEKDWEAYKLRVKSMLHGKDNEIKSLREGMNLTEDTKLLMEQVESLKEERDSLAEGMLRARSECAESRRCREQGEARRAAAEQVVAALRDALRDERAARTRADTQCLAIGKELKSIQMESSQIIADLRSALREKDNELSQLRDSTTTVTADTSALNVADYDAVQNSIDNDKIQYLTHTLVQRQTKIDSLVADNNMLRIQMDKLQTRLKQEMHRGSHAVVQVQDSESRRRNGERESRLSSFLIRMALMIKRYPLFRIFIIIYMLGLHLWVFTVLLTSTPDNYAVRSSRT